MPTPQTEPAAHSRSLVHPSPSSQRPAQYPPQLLSRSSPHCLPAHCGSQAHEPQSLSAVPQLGASIGGALQIGGAQTLSNGAPTAEPRPSTQTSSAPQPPACRGSHGRALTQFSPHGELSKPQPAATGSSRHCGFRQMSVPRGNPCLGRGVQRRAHLRGESGAEAHSSPGWPSPGAWVAQFGPVQGGSQTQITWPVEAPSPQWPCPEQSG